MFKEQDLMKEFLKENSIQYCDGLYIVGERLYGYSTPESPYEIFVIVKNDEQKEEFLNSIINIPIKAEIKIRTEFEFLYGLKNSELDCVEIVFSPWKNQLKHYKTEEVLNVMDMPKIQNVFKNKGTVLWQYGKDIVENQKATSYFDEGLNVCFHAIRMLDFAKQIKKFNQIKNYESVKSVFFEMKECYNLSQLIDKFENKFKSDLMELGVSTKPQKSMIS